MNHDPVADALKREVSPLQQTFNEACAGNVEAQTAIVTALIDYVERGSLSGAHIPDTTQPPLIANAHLHNTAPKPNNR